MTERKTIEKLTLRNFQAQLEAIHDVVETVAIDSVVEVNLTAAFLHCVKAASLAIDVLLEPSLGGGES